MAEVAEQFLIQQNYQELTSEELQAVRIWAHRGCSMAYPENTIEAFAAAAKIEGITGIELDIQLTKDREIVVIHDETVDRTTNGKGNVCEYTLEKLKELEIASVNGTKTKIPTLREVFEALKPACQENGLLINIEIQSSFKYSNKLVAAFLPTFLNCEEDKNLIIFSLLVGIFLYISTTWI